MKIGLGSQDSIGQTQNSSQTTRAGKSSGGSQGLKSQQFGLDRVDVSDVAQTAASVIGISGDQRAQRVANLTQVYQSGQYTVDPVKLSAAIVQQDTDPTHAGH
jgi:anti-sigma28 factor (negative regulator of flagellin synthesis)